MNPLFFDLAIVLVVLILGVLGARRGLVLSLCGLLAFFVAFAAADFVSRRYAGEVSGVIEPAIHQQVQRILLHSTQGAQEADLPAAAPSDSHTDYTPALPGASVVPPATSAPTDLMSMQEALEALGRSGVFSGFQTAVENAVEEGVIQVVTTASAAIAHYLAAQVARIGLFLLTFLLVLLAWWLLSHALDLAFRLPVLRTFNRLGGFAVGLAKGVLLLLILCWALRWLDFIPAETVAKTYLFRHFMDFHLT
jgi:uncharacterized membrane protein required for colicin V production